MQILANVFGRLNLVRFEVNMLAPMLIMTPQGLYCRAGHFYIDPSGAVENAVITHAHSDHARRGSRRYFSARSGVGLVRARLGKSIDITGIEFGAKFRIGRVTLSFHPAGHILGSSQVRLELDGEVWVSSGDYKRDHDPTCEPFETVECDTFVTEATFGTPAYNWPSSENVGAEIHEWWMNNSKRGVNSVLFAYSLGKSQRVLGVLHPHTTREVHCHPAMREMNDWYRQEGVKLAPSICLSGVRRRLQGELLLVPQAFLKSDQAHILGDRYETAFASGWMAQSAGFGRTKAYDRGFVMSDHADWKDLVRTILESKAKRVYVQHRGKGALVRHLKTLGIEAYPDSDLFPKAVDQLSLF